MTEKLTKQWPAILLRMALKRNIQCSSVKRRVPKIKCKVGTTNKREYTITRMNNDRFYQTLPSLNR